jgi:CxC5 like cysteine cluster associated with KDZ transposases
VRVLMFYHCSKPDPCNFSAYRDLYPPMRVCQLAGCPNFRENEDVVTLTEPVSHKATLFTLRDGALPVHSTSLYCRGVYRCGQCNFVITDLPKCQHVRVDTTTIIVYMHKVRAGLTTVESPMLSKLPNIILLRALCWSCS